MARKQAVTLAAIAKQAGVHLSTVSRAVAFGAGVGDANAERIRAIAREMGYQPDPHASSLRTGRSREIGVIVPRLTDYVLARIYEGVDMAARSAGYRTSVANSSDDPESRLESLEQFTGRRVDGIVVGDGRLDGDELVLSLRRRGIPYVLVNRRLRGHPSVTTDDLLGGRLAGDHLVNAGHRDVAVVAGPSFASTCVERTLGFIQRFQAAGIDVPETQVINSGADVKAGHEAALAALSVNPKITAIFAINDFAAIGAMGAAREHGRIPGRDIAIVGYNDIPMCEYLTIPMTSVSSPMLEMGRRGGLALIESIESGQTDAPQRLKPRLNVRESSEWTPS